MQLDVAQHYPVWATTPAARREDQDGAADLVEQFAGAASSLPYHGRSSGGGISKKCARLRYCVIFSGSKQPDRSADRPHLLPAEPSHHELRGLLERQCRGLTVRCATIRSSSRKVQESRSLGVRETTWCPPLARSGPPAPRGFSELLHESPSSASGRPSRLFAARPARSLSEAKRTLAGQTDEKTQTFYRAISNAYMFAVLFRLARQSLQFSTPDEPSDYSITSA